MTMGKQNDILTDCDKRLIARMEEVIAQIKGEPNNGRATIVESVDAKSIRERPGMSQSVFFVPTGSLSRLCSAGSTAGITQTARPPSPCGRLRSFPIKSKKHERQSSRRPIGSDARANRAIGIPH